MNCNWLKHQCFITAVFNWVSKVISQLLWFYIATVLVPLSRPIRGKTKTNRDLPVSVFPRLAPAKIQFNSIHMYWLRVLIRSWIVCVCCDWSEWLLWFWFYDTYLKTALSRLLFICYLIIFKHRSSLSITWKMIIKCERFTPIDKNRIQTHLLSSDVSNLSYVGKGLGF